ncbi:sulfatase [Parapedobacter indicus]|uniref:Arylsulfatase A n=1 Tax=Parapedobacter indicus TaxID=1477437 RepID=A0A1I3F9G0_9SPHI|nr:sulfatase [Parapedobacter indicus]PPL03618.1 arylsulfatase A-like enzyme [Parapedobacter indicus]SFI07828.1 Arylsulfatase A [Parapedobacter indicus]
MIYYKKPPFQLHCRSLWLAMLLWIILPAHAAQAQDEKPNIVLILIDDMGWKDAGFMGSDFYETPHIDQLAKEGKVFTNAYAAAGNCAPSRACLLSGQYTPRHGVYAVNSTDRGPKEKMRLTPTPNSTVLPAENFTVAEALKANGYATAMFGKWHLGGGAGTRPSDQGFDVGAEMKVPKEKEFKETNDPKGIYRITEDACAFMEAHKDGPFFLYVAHHATHMAIQAREEWYDHFGKKPKGTLHGDDRFAAMNAQMDDGVGQLLEKINALGIADRTLVIFMSDNGGLPRSSQHPLRAFKGAYYEGGIRVPLIARWPGKIKAGSTTDIPVLNTDLYPTFVELAGGKLPTDKVLDGESLVEIFAGTGSSVRKPKFWFFPGYLDKADPGARDTDFRTRPVTVVRKGDWKLLLYHEEWLLDGGRDRLSTNRAVELYNLRNDISEQHNLANDAIEKRDELLTDILAWHEQVDAKLPLTVKK